MTANRSEGGPVAVVGVGAMGGRMAARLMDAGRPVIVWNRTPEKVAPLVARGAERASSPAEAAARSRVVITMLAGPAAVRAVAAGDRGILSGIAAPSTWIEMSTVGPRTISWLSERLPQGVDLLDAPVLGSTSEAEAGSLQIFAGGDAAVVERHASLLTTLGSVLRTGPRGSGAAAKLVANLTLLSTVAVVGEALALASALGLDREVAWELLAATPLAAQAERRRASVEAGAFPLRFSLALARKDGALIADAARDAGADVRVAGAAAAWFEEALDAGLGDEDYSAVIRHIVEKR